MKVSILGTGAYGIALASILNYNKLDVAMWTNSEEERDILTKKRRSEKIGYDIPEDIFISTNMQEVVENASIIFIAVPTKFVGDVSKSLSEYYKKKQIICIASKGIEQNSCLFLYDVVKKYIKSEKIAIISGGSFAIDIVNKNPIGLSLATKSSQAKNLIIKAMENEYVKLRYTRDIIGIEICGSIKNVIAIASGMIDGMGYSESTSAMFITESLHDIKSLIDSLGGNKKTILSFAGFGDLLLTCTSKKSRNYTLGKMIGEGRNREEIQKYIDSTTIEGLYTLKSIKRLLRNKKIKMPIINLIYDIIVLEKEPEELAKFLIEKE